VDWGGQEGTQTEGTRLHQLEHVLGEKTRPQSVSTEQDRRLMTDQAKHPCGGTKHIDVKKTWWGFGGVQDECPCARTKQTQGGRCTCSLTPVAGKQKKLRFAGLEWEGEQKKWKIGRNIGGVLKRL